MEERAGESDSTQQLDGEDDAVPLLAVRDNQLPTDRGNSRCAGACARVTHLVLTLPFLTIVAAYVLSIACYYDVENNIGGCVLFGKIQQRGAGNDSLIPGHKAFCLTVTCGEVVLCVIAAAFVIVLVVKAFISRRL